MVREIPRFFDGEGLKVSPLFSSVKIRHYFCRVLFPAGVIPRKSAAAAEEQRASRRASRGEGRQGQAGGQKRITRVMSGKTTRGEELWLLSSSERRRRSPFSLCVSVSLAHTSCPGQAAAAAQVCTARGGRPRTRMSPPDDQREWTRAGPGRAFS